MKKGLKKSGLVLSLALGVSLIGQVAYAGQNAERANPYIPYNFRLPATGYSTTASLVKSNNDDYAENYPSYFGWKGAYVDWWMIDSDGKQISKTKQYSGTGVSSSNYVQAGKNYNGIEVRARMKTSLTTVHEVDVEGKIYP